MDHTAQALAAIALLRSLPNWDRVAAVYGGIDAHLLDLANDLTREDWAGVNPSDEHLADALADA